MNNEELKKLLKDFYEGMTTEEEEMLLKDYFLTEEIPEELAPDSSFFTTLYTVQEPECPVGLEVNLMEMINKKAEEERIFFHRHRTRQRWRWLGGIAATLLLLVVLGYSLATFRQVSPKDTFTDPQEAYLALQATLTEVSHELNSGLNQWSETKKEIRHIHQEIIQEIKQ
ncbi:MAG: hypothetical protein LIP08_05045 [Bacteroides sp.]|nr:hypothetical protein [Bacteroides sp.]